MPTSEQYRKEFTERLNLACDRAAHIPPHGKGRQEVIRNHFKLAPEAVSKWFKGVSVPKPDRMRELADFLGVEHTWLALGTDPDMDRRQRKMHAKESEGAAHLVWGLISLAGGHCGVPANNDPRKDYVDFDVVMMGSAFPVHVALAIDNENGTLDVTIPRQYPSVKIICVVREGSGKFAFLQMPVDSIDAVAVSKGADFVVTLTRASSRKYVTDDITWPVIQDFAEMA